MFKIDLILPILKGLGMFLKNLFLGLFFIKVGKDKVTLDAFKQEDKNVKKIKIISSNLDSKSRAAKRKLLVDTETGNDN